ncbi:MAG: hypothetical protein O2U62_00910 [Candidatus Bathyarchaeota archaeon]|nr:hypothetical protein [Candidatus Bathyarchaeota archaeon]
MRKILTSMVATLVILGALFAFSGVATADKPTAITFEWVLTQNTQGPLINEGPWSASGVVSDSGDMVQYLHMRPNKPALSETTLTSDLGTIRICSVAQTIAVISEDPFIVRIEGIWFITGGTGAYAQLSGHGTEVVEVNVDLAIQGLPSNFGTQTGTAHLPH